MTEPIVTALYAFGGVAVGALLSFLGHYMVARENRHAEERKARREMALVTARMKFDLARDFLAKTGGGNSGPFDIYVLREVRLMQIVSDENLSAADIAQKVRELRRFCEEVRAAYEEEGNK